MKVALVLLLAACTTPVREPDEPSPLPDGVFTPVRAVGAAELRIVADGDALWFAYTTVLDQVRHLWLAKTTLDGELAVDPRRVNREGAAMQPTLARRSDAVAVAYRVVGGNVRTRLYDHEAEPLREDAGQLAVDPWRLELVARPSGGYRLVTWTPDPAGEILVHALDAGGDPTGETTQLGANPSTMTSSPNTLAAASTTDDRTLIVWDRVYENCTGRIPYEALTATTAPTVEPLFDSPGQNEWQPAVATFDTAGYAAWRTDFELRSTISIARFDEPYVVLGEVGDVTAFNANPVLAMNGPRSGAIAWQADEEYKLATFVDTGSAIVLGAVHTVQPVADAAVVSFLTDTNLVSVGDDRFVLGWVEHQHRGERNIYAKVLDLAAPPSPTPPRTVRRERARVRPCSH